jgi:hypothetical protein
LKESHSDSEWDFFYLQSFLNVLFFDFIMV